VSEPDVPDDLIDGEVVSIVDSAPLAALAAAEAAEAAQASTADPEFHEAEPLEQMAAAGKKFGTIYADPPWRTAIRRTRASTDNHYETMSVEEIAELPIAELAARSAICGCGRRMRSCSSAPVVRCVGLRVQVVLRLGEVANGHRQLPPQRARVPVARGEGRIDRRWQGCPLMGRVPAWLAFCKT
jgi:hypothetical protein